MRKVLFLNPFYYPGFRSGGPQQTLSNIVDVYGCENCIYIMTQNYDFGDKKPYEGVVTGEWVYAFGARIKYLSRKRYHCGRDYLIAYKKFNTIYSCGLFCVNSIWMMFIHRCIQEKQKKIFVAPMGVFSKGAFEEKYIKKKLFISLCKKLKLFKNIYWSFSSDKELEEALSIIGKSEIQDRYIIAEDLPRKVEFDEKKKRIGVYKKKKGYLKVVYLSRITPKKNLKFAVELLCENYKGNIEFDIYGVIDDDAYFHECKKKWFISRDNVQIHYRGEVKTEDVLETFEKYDVFLFPTKGENYGHVIYEALATGCLPVISDKTPWNDICEAQCGYVIDLSNISGFHEIIQTLIDMDNPKMHGMKEKAIRYAEEKYNEAMECSGYVNLFQRG